MTLPMVIGYYKMNTPKAINIANHTRGTPVWQRNYYEHIIRNQDSLNRIPVTFRRTQSNGPLTLNTPIAQSKDEQQHGNLDLQF